MVQMGYKVYNKDRKGYDKQLLVEIRLKEQIHQTFNSYEKTLIINNSVISMLNLVTFDIQKFFK